MKSRCKSRLIRSSGSTAIAATFLTLLALNGSARAQQSVLERAYLDVEDEVTVGALAADPSLQKTVSLEVKRLPLHELLAQLQTQSGVKLSLGADAPADKLITARVDQMPLATFMATLSRVYGVTWLSEGNSYFMRGNQRGDLHLKLLQMGDLAQYRARYSLFNRQEREQGKVSVGRDIVQQVGLAALRAPQGVAVGELSPTLRQRLRQVLEDPAIESLNQQLFASNQRIAQGGFVLRFGAAENGVLNTRAISIFNGAAPDSNLLRFSVRDEDGRPVTQVFNSMNAVVAKPGEQDVQAPKPRRRR